MATENTETPPYTRIVVPPLPQPPTGFHSLPCRSPVGGGEPQFLAGSGNPCFPWLTRVGREGSSSTEAVDGLPKDRPLPITPRPRSTAHHPLRRLYAQIGPRGCRRECAASTQQRLLPPRGCPPQETPPWQSLVRRQNGVGRSTKSSSQFEEVPPTRRALFRGRTDCESRGGIHDALSPPRRAPSC